MEKTFYITTPIYFSSDKLHIGHAYCTVAADTMARYKRLRGFDVFFLTGTDEHGQKIERIATQKGVSPKQYVDDIYVAIKELWKTMNISYDKFIRTTDKEHEECVQKIFKTLYDQGDIYKSKYEGLYCTPCEAFFTEGQLNDGKCPDCGRTVEIVSEENYFFRLSKYQDRLIKHIEENPDFIKPDTRQNEMINNFLKPGLSDLAVSRTSFKWGIPVEFAPGHIIYVWIDALSNYISALGYGTDHGQLYQKYWPADVHLVGKEIVRFHTIIWPAMLMALDLPLPKQIFGHGWLIIDGGKMSKSKGNVVDPNVLVKRYGVDALRYFLLREVAFGQDGNFTNEALIQRINSDLANDLGNLLSRTVGMVEKYFNNTIPLKQQETEYDASLQQMAKETVSKVENLMDKMLFSDSLSEIWAFVRKTNKYIDETSPWVLAKDGDNKERLANVMYHLAECLRIISILIKPFMPDTSAGIAQQLQIQDNSLLLWENTGFGKLPKNITVCKGAALFPRIDIKKELEDLARDIAVANKETTLSKIDAKKKETISIDDFDRLDLKIGTVLQCEKVEGSDKLLKSQIKIGQEARQIVSGIAKHYAPEEMIGKKVVVVTNLKPVKIRGQLSEGMILAASDEEGHLSVITCDKEIEDGSEVS